MTPIHIFSSVLLALVQAPAPSRGNDDGRPAPIPTEVVAHARAFPESTLACLSLAASGTQIDALTATPLLAALTGELAQRGVTTAALDRVLRDATGVGFSQWLTLLHNGVTVGLTGIEDDGSVHWLVVADAQDHAAGFALLLDRLRQANGVTAMAAEDGGARTWTLTTTRARAAITIADNKIVAGDSSATVNAALTRLRSTEVTKSLASAADFANFELTGSAQRDRLLAAWVRPSLIVERIVGTLADDAQGAAKLQGVLRALDLTRVAGLGMTLAREGDTFVEDFHVDWPGPRNGPLAEILAPKSTLRSEVAALVPADFDSFSASAVDLQRLFHGTMRLLSEVAPSAARFVQAQITAAGEAVGVKLEDELLGRVGSQVVNLQWGTGDNQSTAVLIQLTDAPLFERALQRVVSGAAGVHEQSINGYRTLVFDAGGREVAVTVTEDSVVLATSTAAMQRTLEQMAAPRGAAPAVQIPSGVSAYGVAKLQPLLAQMEGVLRLAGTRTGGAIGADTFGAGLAALRAAAQTGANITTAAARDDHNVTLHVQSPIGGLASIGLVMGATVAGPALVAWGAQTVAMARPELTLPALLNRVVAAERSFRAAHDGSPSTTLQDLVDAGTIPPGDLGTAVDQQLFERDGYRITVLRGEAKGSNEFAVVAWPAAQRTGPVYAATDEHPLLVNDVMARVAGLARIEIADVYTSGFGSPMRSGWRVADTPATTPEKATPPTAAAGGRLAKAVATLVQGDGDVKDAKALLHTALTGSDPTALAYAAHAAGRLKLTDEVPGLVTLTAKCPDPLVRTQAMWALLQIGDARSTQIAIDALSSEIVELRALAAANLGKLRATPATSALLGILPKQADATDDQRDRAMALLALADIGDPSPLLQIAAAVQDGDAPTVQALTYAFQTLSPKLTPKEEATTLVAVLDHPQPMLRRYVIQRLGELRQPVTVRALESRLANESRELLPLVEVSLLAIRRQTGDGTTGTSFADRLQQMMRRAQTTWDGLAPNHRYAVFGLAIALIAGLMLIGVLRRRTRSRAQGDAWAAMAASSQSGQFRGQDEVDLSVGESGVYSPHDAEEDKLLQPTSEQLAAPYR